VLIVNTDLVPRDERPDSIEDLADPTWKDRVGIAKPLFGTTATHAAVLFADWGEARARDYFSRLQENARVMSGNKQVALAVGRGQLAFGLTDTDDAIIELEQGRPVAIVFPDQQPGGQGALFIPNTVCVIRGSRHGDRARQLVDYLLTPAVERRLAKGRSAQIPVNPQVADRSRVMPPEAVRWMEVDFAAAARVWETAAVFLRDEFAAAD
jgi:iron(III) transport system substrate-binding protein